MRISDWSSDVCSSDLGGTRIGRVEGKAWRQLHAALTGQILPGTSPGIRVAQRIDNQELLAGAARRASKDVLQPNEDIRIFSGRIPIRKILKIGGRACQRRMPTIDVVVLKRSEEHTSELQSLMRISYAVFCLKKK